MSPKNFSAQTWFSYLDEGLQAQVQLAQKLYTIAQTESDINDYSFVVFPMAKAYEGFLKKFFFDLNLIDQHLYESRRFRIGRALNPDVNPKHRDKDWLFERVSQTCGEELARDLWDGWLEGRNHLFHYFPNKNVVLNFAQAEQMLEKLSSTMTRALACESMQSRQRI